MNQAGVQKNKQKNIPKLRFPEFSEEWQEKKLGENIEEYIERVRVPTNLPILTSSRSGLFRQKDYYDNREVVNEGEYGVLPRGYITYRHMSDDLVFKFNLNNIVDKGAISKEYPVFKTINMNSYFLIMTLNYGTKFKKFAIEQKQGGTRTRLYLKNLKKLAVTLPSLKEQQKIADFLTSVDEKISFLDNKVKLLQKYKKGVMQKIFSQEIRFKNENGNNYSDWNELKIGEIFHQREERYENGLDLLSVTISSGVVKRSGIEGKDNSSADKSNYKKVCIDDIVYNSMRMWQGASGVSKFDGVVSPAYTVLKSNKKNCSRFFGYYFKLPKLIYTFKRYSQGLTSDTWNLKYPQISVIKISVPSYPEQQKIADFLTSIDDIITLEENRLEKAKKVKKSLLQQMII